MSIQSLTVPAPAADFADLQVGKVAESNADPSTHPSTHPSTWSEVATLADVPVAAWRRLAEASLAPNAFYLPEWARAVNAHATGKTGARALLVWDGPARERLIGLLPVVSAWRALRIPVPALVAWQAYAPLTTPLLDRTVATAAARGLLKAARDAGAKALLVPFVEMESRVAEALRSAALARGGEAWTIGAHERARLDAGVDPEAMFKSALGAKKLKELRRQRHRLADAGSVTFAASSSPDNLPAALATFLRLEGGGWKGERGTALASDPGDAAFVQEATAALAARGQAEIVTLSHGGEPVAAGLVLRHGRRAFFFKIAYDERLSKLSPGVQLTLDLTQRLCADPDIDDADSIAIAGHPMINRIWPARLPVGDLLMPTGHGAGIILPVFAASIAARECARRTVHRFRHR